MVKLAGKILLAITGGIAAYKMLDVISGLIKNGFEVHVMCTENAKKFVTPDALAAISNGNYVEESLDRIVHIRESEWCDLFVCAPATANIIGKFANGIADDLVTTTLLALSQSKDAHIYPAMNVHMYKSRAVINNIKELKEEYSLFEPDYGMLACGYEGLGKLPKPRQIVKNIIEHFNDTPVWKFPLGSQLVGSTIDSYSFLDLQSYEVEIPLHPHVGAFGIRRRHDIHKGIDLYAREGAEVTAVEDGKIVEICPFTGPKAGFYWWLDTYGVYVEGKSGIVVYGEIFVDEDLKIGDEITADSVIGRVARVLKTDRGRPVSMLHLELHVHDSIHVGQWSKNTSIRPGAILDPTPHLLRILNKTKYCYEN